MRLVLDFVFCELLEQIIYIYIYISQFALAFIWQDYESMTEIRRKIRPKIFLKSGKHYSSLDGYLLA